MQGKEERSTGAVTYAGIDTSKGQLDIYLHPSSEAFRVANNKAGWQSLCKKLKAQNIALVVVEATGKYHRGVHQCLTEAGLRVAVVNPYRSRKFAEALGALAKTDKIDARVLALAGEALKPSATPPVKKVLQNLQELVNTIAELKGERTANRNRIRGCENPVVKRCLNDHLRGIGKRIKRMECEVITLIKADSALWRRHEILTSIPGIGPVVAVTLIALLDELGSCSAKQIAALVGVAPMNCDSGQMHGARRIRGGRPNVRSILYMAAVSAARCVRSDLRVFYQGLINRGKPAKVALTAVIRKLAILANTLIAEDRTWQTNRP